MNCVNKSYTIERSGGFSELLLPAVVYEQSVVSQIRCRPKEKCIKRHNRQNLDFNIVKLVTA